MNLLIKILRGIGRALFGDARAKTLNELRDRNYTLQQFRDYTLTHWTWEEDRTSKDEWQEPHKAFESLQSLNTPSDCDDYATATWYCLSKRYDCQMVYITDNKTAHAICLVQEGGKFYYLDNIRRSIYPFKSIRDLFSDVYSHWTFARKYDFKEGKITPGEIIWRR